MSDRKCWIGRMCSDDPTYFHYRHLRPRYGREIRLVRHYAVYRYRCDSPTYPTPTTVRHPAPDEHREPLLARSWKIVHDSAVDLRRDEERSDPEQHRRSDPLAGRNDPADPTRGTAYSWELLSRPTSNADSCKPELWAGQTEGAGAQGTSPLSGRCPAASYSPTRSPAQYHRR